MSKTPSKTPTADILYLTRSRSKADDETDNRSLQPKKMRAYNMQTVL